MGGNPIYHTTKGSPTDIEDGIHTLIKQNLQDLGGHHVVFQTATDAVTEEEYMFISKAPLTAATIHTKSDLLPAVSIYEHSLASTNTYGEFGWLSNVAATMVYEATDLLDELYPITPLHTNSKWSCPMRRIAFWTSLTTNFNPLVPSPVRAARLFGTANLGMTHGTRSHPTQLFRPLTRVANVVTTNGFCFCADVENCSVLLSDHTDVCSLAQTIQSLYDGQYRDSKIHTASPCNSQLDWPYEGGTMRDGSTSTDRNTNEECNVLDRLPPFKYKYAASGKIYRPSSQKTTIDQGMF
jgi:hypothetical protein